MIEPKYQTLNGLFSTVCFGFPSTKGSIVGNANNGMISSETYANSSRKARIGTTSWRPLCVFGRKK